MGTTTGDPGAETVHAIWRYPVKSMLGEEMRAGEVTPRGIVGDRAYALVDKAPSALYALPVLLTFTVGWPPLAG